MVFPEKVRFFSLQGTQVSDFWLQSLVLVRQAGLTRGLFDDLRREPIAVVSGPVGPGFPR